MSEQKPPVLGQNNPNSHHPELDSGSRPYDDEIDLLELWRALMRGKWIIISFTALFSVASVFYALSLPNMYKSTAVLAPAESASGGGLAKLAGQFGGLASLAGINLGGSGSNKTAEALEILQSWAFIEEFIQEQNIAPQVFAVKGWNPETNELIYDTEIYDPQTQAWTREPPKGKKAEPSSWELYKKFSFNLVAEEDDKKGFIALSVEYYSPELAKEWVKKIIDKINLRVRERDSKEATENIAFLKQQIDATALSSMQSVFYDLIEGQTKTLMLSMSSSEYVFRIVSEARASEEKSKPNRVLICVVGALIGVFVGCIYVVLQNSSVSSRPRETDC